MKIEHSAVVTIGDTEDASLFLNILTSFDTQAEKILTGYVAQKSWGEEMPGAMKHPHQDVLIAIGTPEQGETITTVLQKGEKEEWYPASLVHWDSYRKSHGDNIHQVAIMGTVCRDDDFHEWVFTIAHKKILGVKREYIASAKQWRDIRLKTLPVLLVKIPRKKT